MAGKLRLLKEKQFLGMGALLCAAVMLCAACGGNYKDPTTTEGKQAIIEDVNRYLSVGDCDRAIETLKPVYDSANTDNGIRMVMASAYACKANLNFFGMIMDLVNNTAAMSLVAGKTGLFGLMAKLFPATNAAPDKVMEGGLLAQDALMATLKPAAVILPEARFFLATPNPASANYVDRTDDANTYLFFVAIATLGAIENQFFAIDKTAGYTLTVPIPWQVATAIDENACAYAASLMNLSDAVTALQSSVTGPVKEVFTQVGPVVTALDTACIAGCSTAVISAACNTGCTTCPLSLRNRYACTKVDGDPASCAAANLNKAISLLWGPVP